MRPARIARRLSGLVELLRGKPLIPLLRRQLNFVRAHGPRATLRRYRARLLSAGVDGSAYDAWLNVQGYRHVDVDRLRAESARFPERPTISVIVPVRDSDPAWLRACVASVTGQAYPSWQLHLCDEGGAGATTLAGLAEIEQSDPRIGLLRRERREAAGAVQRALSLASGDFVALLGQHDQLAPDALYQVVKTLQHHPDADLLYSDEDRIEPDGSWTEPHFKPGWSPDYLRSTMYIGRLAVYRRRIVLAAGGLGDLSDDARDYDLALRVTEQTARVFRIPRILYHRRTARFADTGSFEAHRSTDADSARAVTDHLARLNLDAQVEAQPGPGRWRVRYRVIGQPLVTIIIPTAGRIVQKPSGPRDLLLDCVRSIVERTAYERYELLVVDDGHLSAAAESYLASIPHRRISFPSTGPFNFSEKVNFSAEHARGEHLLLLNDDTEVLNAEWLTAMLELSQQPGVGAVGAKLYYPDSRLQHVGVILGFGGGADHVFRGQPPEHPGYFGSAQMIRNYSAVTAACLMTRRDVFGEVGGFDPRFATDFNDVDYCLRLGTRGYRVVFTPFAELYHHEGGSFGSREGKVNPRETRAFHQRWRRLIDDDPFYNPNLSRVSLDYRPGW